MNAVVMAGGLGTRLHPLTCLLPKPMLPLFDRPLISYILQKLQLSGVSRAVLTLHYCPESIEQYLGDGAALGLQLTYAVEPQPLGTAGSVRHAAPGASETLLVLSGDVLFGFELIPAFEFHRQKGALATLLLLRHHDPRGFGIAALDREGRITRYMEKPAVPHEIFSNLVNTGTYFLEPEVLELVPPGTFFDFSRDLFPLLLARKMPLYGYVVEGFWSDLGTFAAYRQAHNLAFAGEGGITVPGEEVSPGIWMEQHVNIAGGVQLLPPLFLGAGACLEEGAVAGPAAVIGAGSYLSRGSSVGRSILGPGNRLGAGAVLEGALLGANNLIGAYSRLGEMVVLGGECCLAEHCLLEEVKIWPRLTLPPHTRLSQTVIDS